MGTNDRIIGFTTGCFQKFHLGHLDLLKKAKQHCNYLIVAINNDQYIKNKKGRVEIEELEKRAEKLRATGLVDEILVFYDNPLPLILDIKPRYIFVGNDYSKEEVVGHNECREWGGEVIITERIGISTTDMLNKLQIEIKKLSNDAVIPTKNKEYDAGYDLYSIEDAVLKPLERKLFKTGISMNILPGYYGRIADRSGNALKLGLTCLGGVVDSGFCGEIGVILYNTNGGSEDFIFIKKGQRIAQIIIEKCYNVEFKEVLELAETDRGDKGFGSSGN